MLITYRNYFLKAKVGLQEIQLLVPENVLEQILSVLRYNQAQHVEYVLEPDYKDVSRAFVGTHIN